MKNQNKRTIISKDPIKMLKQEAFYPLAMMDNLPQKVIKFGKSDKRERNGEADSR